MKLRRVVHEVIAMENLLWIVAIAIVATWLAVQIMRGRISRGNSSVQEGRGSHRGLSRE